MYQGLSFSASSLSIVLVLPACSCVRARSARLLLCDLRRGLLRWRGLARLRRRRRRGWAVLALDLEPEDFGLERQVNVVGLPDKVFGLYLDLFALSLDAYALEEAVGEFEAS